MSKEKDSKEPNYKRREYVDKDHAHVQDHPAGVTVQFSRVSGSKEFFGSSVKSHSWIQLRIYKAKLESSFGHDQAHQGEQLIEVDLSPSQFAELLTTMNYGCGVFGTMSYFNRKHIDKYEAPPSEMARTEEYVEKHLTHAFEQHKANIQRMRECIENSKLPKKDKDAMLRDLGVDEHLESNFSFYKERLRETSGKLIVQAKAEIESHINTSIQNAGLEHLRSSMPQVQLEGGGVKK